MSDFAEVTSPTFVKYVSKDTWDHLQQGSFKFGSASHYRSIENPNIRDAREGYGHFSLQDDNSNQLNVSLLAGNNCVLYCGTRENVEDKTMRERFGPLRIQIDDVTGFMDRARKCLGASKARIVDVVYRNAAHFSTELETVGKFIEITSRGACAPTTLRKLNRQYFGPFYEFGLLPGLFIKPVGYAIERERRMAFELRKDRREAIIREDKKLLSYVKFLPD